MTTLAPATTARNFKWATWLGKLGPLLGLIFVFVLFTVLTALKSDAGEFATIENVQVIVQQTAVVGVATFGATLVIISGGIDLSVGSVMALTTVVIAQLLLRHWSATAAAAGGVLAAASCGLAIGLIITRLRLAPFIVTLGFWGAVRGVAGLLANSVEVYPPTKPRFSWDWRESWLFGLLRDVPSERWWMLEPAGVWVMLILAVVVTAMLRYTRVGRHIFAVGSNEQTARLCGIRVDRTKLLLYIAGGLFAGLAGVLEFSKISMGSFSDLDGAELDVIAAVVIGGASLTGGRGSIFGSLIGALIMTTVASGCTKMHFPSPVQKIATGAIIIFAVSLDRFRHRGEKT